MGASERERRLEWARMMATEEDFPDVLLYEDGFRQAASNRWRLAPEGAAVEEMVGVWKTESKREGGAVANPSDTQGLDLAAIAERCEKATPGPWVAGRPDMATIVDGIDSKWIYGPKGETESSEYLAVASGHIDGPWERVMANAEFIAHSREDVPALLAHVARLESELSRLRSGMVESGPGFTLVETAPCLCGGEMELSYSCPTCGERIAVAIPEPMP